MQIKPINARLNFRNAYNSNSSLNLTRQSEEKQQIIKDLLQRKSDEKYKEDLRTNKIELVGMGAFSAIGTILCAVTKEIEKEQVIALTFGWLLTLAALLSKPQKEKYDAQVEIDLKKEMENENKPN